MNCRCLASLSGVALALGLTVGLFAPLPMAAQAEAYYPKTITKPWTQKTPDGYPDLQGYWTNNSYIRLERPANVTKELYTPEELAEANKRSAEREAEQTTPGTVGDVHYDFTQFALDRSQTRLTNDLRTGMITDPPDGHLPPRVGADAGAANSMTRSRVA